MTSTGFLASSRTIVYLPYILPTPVHVSSFSLTPVLLISIFPNHSQRYLSEALWRKSSNAVRGHLFSILTSLANILTSETLSSNMDKVGGGQPPVHALTQRISYHCSRLANMYSLSGRTSRVGSEQFALSDCPRIHVTVDHTNSMEKAFSAV